MSVVFDGLSELPSWALILFMACSFEAVTIGYSGLETLLRGNSTPNGALERSAFKSFEFFNVWFCVLTAQFGKSPKWSCRTCIRFRNGTTNIKTSQLRLAAPSVLHRSRHTTSTRASPAK